jgi:hypothetical protein
MKENIERLMSNKRKAKKYLADTFSFPVKNPLIGVFLEKDLSKEQSETLDQILTACKALEIEIVVLGKNLPYNRKNRSLLLDGADAALTFEFNDVQEMLLHGTIPVSGERSEVKDYNPNHETGNAFLFKDENVWHIFASIVRALETFKFPYDWRNIIRHGLDSVEV